MCLEAEFSNYAEKHKRSVKIKIWTARIIIFIIGMFVMYAATKGKEAHDASKTPKVKTDFKQGIKGN